MSEFEDKSVFASLDIGSSKVTMLAAQFDREGNLRVIGYGETKSHGVRKGVIHNIEATKKDIEVVSADVKRMSSVDIHDVVVNISGDHISHINNDGMASIMNNSVTEQDRDRAVEGARNIKLDSAVAILHTQVQYYKVDRSKETSDPVNMRGVRRLDAFVHLITCEETIAANIRTCVSRAGLQVQSLMNSSWAAAEAVSSTQERDQGTIVIDMGAQTCDMVVYCKSNDRGYINYSVVLPCGGDNATQDMASVLRIKSSYAEEIKLNYGCVYPELISEEEEVTIENQGEKEQSSRGEITNALHQRYHQIFSWLYEDLQKQGVIENLTNSAGVILTGGAALIQGAPELASEIFERPVHLVKPRINAALDMNDLVDSAHYATAIGMLLQARKVRSVAGNSVKKAVAKKETVVSQQPEKVGVWKRFVQDWL